MLVSLIVEGFKGFKEKTKIDFSKTKGYNFNTEAIKNGIVNKSIIYGKNASGKSNIGYAIFDLVSNLTDKYNGKEIYENYLNAEKTDGVANFEYIFKFNKSIVTYKYSKKSLENILKEELLINNKRVIYYDFIERKPLETYLKGTENLNKNFDLKNLSAIKYVYRNSVLENNEENIVFKKFMEFVDTMLFFRCLNQNNYIGFQNGSKNILEAIVENGHLNEFESFLNEEGVSCKLIEKNDNGRKTIAFKIANSEISFSEIASTGTNALALFFYWYKEISKASLVFIDEFDAFYHFELSEKIVKKLLKLDSQIMLTTHNTSIMTNELLRPDCYFIIFENKYFKPIFELTEKELREGHNLEKILRASGFKS